MKQKVKKSYRLRMGDLMGTFRCFSEGFRGGGGRAGGEDGIVAAPLCLFEVGGIEPTAALVLVLTRSAPPFCFRIARRLAIVLERELALL